MANCDQYVIDGGEPRKCARNAVPGDTLCAHHRKTAESTGYAPAKTSPTQRALADAQPVACDVVSIDGGIVAQRVSIAYANEMLLALEWDGCSKANFVYSESDYAALQARIAELEASNGRVRALLPKWREHIERYDANCDPHDPEDWIAELRVCFNELSAAIDAHAQGHNQGEPC